MKKDGPPRKMTEQERIERAQTDYQAIVGEPACQFEVLGYVEEFQDGVTFKVLGTRRLDKPDRPCGSPGRRHYTLAEDLQLRKGYKAIPVTVKAGTMVIATIQILCGREKPKK